MHCKGMFLDKPLPSPPSPQMIRDTVCSFTNNEMSDKNNPILCILGIKKGDKSMRKKIITRLTGC